MIPRIEAPRVSAAAGSALRGNIAFFCGILCAALGAALPAQEPSLEQFPGLKERAVVMRIVSRIVEQNQEVVWTEENVTATFPGRPVGLKLLGADVAVAVQFTPFLRKSGKHMLVAQGQIWISVPNGGVSYYTTMQTIPLEFYERVYFFPLGPKTEDGGEAQIEIQLIVEPYSDAAGGTNEAGARREQNPVPDAPSSTDAASPPGTPPPAGVPSPPEAAKDRRTPAPR